MLAFGVFAVSSGSSAAAAHALAEILRYHPWVIGALIAVTGAAAIVSGLRVVSRHRYLIGTVVPLVGRVVDVRFQEHRPVPPYRTERYRTVKVALPDGEIQRVEDDRALGSMPVAKGESVAMLYDVDQNILQFADRDVGANRKPGLALARTGLGILACGILAATWAALIQN